MSQVKRKVRGLLNRVGYDVSPLNRSTEVRAVLKRCTDLAGPIRTVVDVGASDGQWSEMVMRWLPDASYLLLDAQVAHTSALERFRQRTGADYLVAAASDKAGDLHFHDDGNLFGGAASHQPFVDNDSVVPGVAIDDLVRERCLQGPYFLKLDTHGHEIEILAGAKDVVSQAALVMLETYAFREVSGLMFDEMCAHMRGLGFRPVGIADVMTRDDGVLWQADIVFAPDEIRVFNRTTYARPDHAAR